MNDLQRFLNIMRGIADAAITIRQWLAFWGPVADASAWLTPLVAAGSVLSLALLTGVAVSALALLLLALMGLYYLLTEVFGVGFEVALPRPVGVANR